MCGEYPPKPGNEYNWGEYVSLEDTTGDVETVDVLLPIRMQPEAILKIDWISLHTLTETSAELSASSSYLWLSVSNAAL